MTGPRRDLSAELTKARDGDVVALSQLVSAVESRRRDLGPVLHDVYTTGATCAAAASALRAGGARHIQVITFARTVR